jgi:hypothetical protein
MNRGSVVSSSVGSVIERMRMQILKDKRLRKRIAELEKKLRKGVKSSLDS